MSTPLPPQPRTCCLLADQVFHISSNLIEPGEFGHHTPAAKQVKPGGMAGTGIMYTLHLGFLDMGHVRDLCDLTKYVYDRLLDGCPGAASRKTPGSTTTCTFEASNKIKTTHGYATLREPVASNDLLRVAQSIAYDDSIGYEIHTYWDFSVGGHNSSFSPEDLPSNYVGTWVAAEAIKRTWTSGKDFDDEVDIVLQELCRKSGARLKNETQSVFDKYVKDKWVKFNSIGHPNDDFLQRRNFTGAFWDPKNDEIDSQFNPGSVGIGFANDLTAYRSRYNFTFQSGRDHFTRDQYFSTKIPSIRADAEKRYTARYDSPSNRAPGVRAPEGVRPGEVLTSSDDVFGAAPDRFAALPLGVAQPPSEESSDSSGGTLAATGSSDEASDSGESTELAATDAGESAEPDAVATNDAVGDEADSDSDTTEDSDETVAEADEPEVAEENEEVVATADETEDSSEDADESDSALAASDEADEADDEDEELAAMDTDDELAAPPV